MIVEEDQGVREAVYEKEDAHGRRDQHHLPGAFRPVQVRATDS